MPRSTAGRVRRLAVPAVGLMAFLLLPGAALAGATGLDLTESASGTVVSTAKGAAITITLESNASTGYHWIEATKPDAAMVVEDDGSGDYVAPETTLIGAAGKQVFTYHAAGDGVTSLVLDYVAPGTNAVGKTFTLTIKVGPEPGMLDAVAPPATTTVPAQGSPVAIALLGVVALAAIVGFGLLERRRTD